MTDRLDTFIEAHPDGWTHQDWLDLLGALKQEGVDVREPEKVGLELERRRVARMLASLEVPGLGPKRIQTLVDTFTTAWNLQRATAADLAEPRTIPQAVADRVFDALHRPG
jgi:hypothetical protein